MQSRKLKYVLIVNFVFPGAGSVFLYSDASPFPVSVTSIAEGPACGTVLSSRSSCSCPGTLRQCLFPELWPWSTHRIGWSILLLEACSSGKRSRCVFGTQRDRETLFVQFWQTEVVSFLWHFLWTCNSTLMTANLMQHWKENIAFLLSPVHPWLNFVNHMAEMVTSSCDVCSFSNDFIFWTVFLLSFTLLSPQATGRLRERGRDSCLAGIQVQQLFCSNNTTIPENQLKELNMKIDNALQVPPETIRL